MISKLAGRRSFVIGTFIFVLIASMAWLLMRDPFVRMMLGATPEEYVTKSVKVGDSESHLIDMLQDNGVDYYKSSEDGQTLYSISDGFVGVCFYYVADGKVVDIVFD